MNDLAQQDREVAEKVVKSADSAAIAAAYSNANPNTAYGLADLLNSISYVNVDEFNANFLAALDRDKLREFARHKSFLNEPFIFSHFCASLVWRDESLALEMAELFIPTAQQVLAEDPVGGFDQLSQDFASRVLRVFDVLGVYVGNLKPTSRQWAIAKRICEKIAPSLAAEQISTVRPRHFQSAAYFLHFLCKSAPRKYHAVLRKLNWGKLDSVISNDWANMPHDTEVLLSALHSRPQVRHLVQKLIADRADRIVQFPPRLMLIAPEVGVAHIAKGGILRLSHYNLVNWSFGGLALAIVGEARRELVEQAVSPFIADIARGLSNYSHDFTGPAEGLVRVVIEYAPVAWREVLGKIDPTVAEKCLSECLAGDPDHKRTAATVIESAINLDGPVGDLARRLRVQFPKASTGPTDPPRFFNTHGRRRRKK
ncbi:MAG: hypothetical protein IAE77_28500 [Prosthecobacter sp.]|uniref:hypothetical protein n=1 Tax=Prosthecobacter sp. TaxID=1965333 RepID=UPI0019E04B09|nr:hypothetical protein [Prosthecobacter sp.]MBE2287429.1 hypothetical protein [Prosthecobacter sp.]